jgi:hypothetical protein
VRARRRRFEALIVEGTYSVMTGLVPAILVFLASMQQKKWMPGSAKRTLVRSRNEYRDRSLPWSMRHHD